MLTNSFRADWTPIMNQLIKRTAAQTPHVGNMPTPQLSADRLSGISLRCLSDWKVLHPHEQVRLQCTAGTPNAPVVPMNDASTPPVSSTAVLLSGRPERSPRSTRPPA